MVHKTGTDPSVTLECTLNSNPHHLTFNHLINYFMIPLLSCSLSFLPHQHPCTTFAFFKMNILIFSTSLIFSSSPFPSLSTLQRKVAQAECFRQDVGIKVAGQVVESLMDYHLSGNTQRTSTLFFCSGLTYQTVISQLIPHFLSSFQSAPYHMSTKTFPVAESSASHIDLSNLFTLVPSVC